MSSQIEKLVNGVWFVIRPNCFPPGGQLSQWQQAQAHISLFQVIAVSVIATLQGDSKCQQDIDALSIASVNAGVDLIDDDSPHFGHRGHICPRCTTATLPESTLNDPQINAKPAVESVPIKDMFKSVPHSTINEAVAQLGGNTVHFRLDHVINLNPFQGAGLVTHEALHNLGLNDPQVMASLGLTAAQCGSATDCISIKFEQDCFQPPAAAPTTIRAKRE